MKRVIRIHGEGVDLTVTIEGNAPPGLPRVLAKEVRGVAFDFVADVALSEETRAEGVTQ